MKKIFLFIFLSYWIFFFLFPPFQNPDEPGHYEVTYYVSQGLYPYIMKNSSISTISPNSPIVQPFEKVIAQQMTIPNYEVIKKNENKTKQMNTSSKKFVPYSDQAYNPPVYYFVSSIFLKVAQLIHVPLLTQFYFARLGSTFFYFGAVLFSYMFMKKIFKDFRVISSLLLFFSLNPITLQAGVGISPDIAVTFFSLLFLYILLLQRKNLQHKRVAILLGLIAGLAMLSKITGIALVPVFIILAIGNIESIKSKIIALTLFLITFLTAQVPWLVLNFSRYHTIMVSQIALGSPMHNRQGSNLILSFIGTLFSFRHAIMHFSGFLGWNEAFLFPFVFIPYTIIFVTLLIVGIFNSHKKSFINLMFHSFLISVFLFFLFFEFQRKFYFNSSWDVGGRNILLIFLPMIYFMYVGLQTLMKKNARHISFFLTCFSIFYYYLVLIFILIPRFYV